MNFFKKLFGSKGKKEEIMYVDPNEIWFSLSTIENGFPNLIESPKFMDFQVQIHGDDWLQQEFISGENSEKVDSLFKEIKLSAANCEQTDGMVLYKKCFPRRIEFEKILPEIHVNDLKVFFEDEELGALSFANYEGYAENTFVAKFSGTFLYGQLDDNYHLKSLGLLNMGDVTDVGKIEEFAKKYQLHFVDWLGGYQIKTNDL